MWISANGDVKDESSSFILYIRNLKSREGKGITQSYTVKDETRTQVFDSQSYANIRNLEAVLG